MTYFICDFSVDFVCLCINLFEISDRGHKTWFVDFGFRPSKEIGLSNVAKHLLLWVIAVTTW